MGLSGLENGQNLEGIVSGEDVRLINRGLKSELPTISLVMIVRNEEENLSKCLNPIKDIVDEIIIVDTGSTDKTVNIARGYTDKVFSYKIPKVEWHGEEVEDINFSDMRNYADKFATCDWILTLDADERIKPEYIQTLKAIIAQQPDIIAYEFPIFNFYEDKGKHYSQHNRYKAYKNHIGIYYQCVIHETIGDSVEERGKAVRIPIPIVHLGYGDPIEHKKRAETRNIPILERATEREPENYFYWYYLGKSYMTIFDNNDKAKKCFEESLKYSKNHLSTELETKFYLGNIALKEGQVKKALQLYNEVITKDPYYPDVHFIVGMIFIDKKRYDVALPYLEHAYKNMQTNKSIINIMKVYFNEKSILEKLQLTAARSKEFSKATAYLIEEVGGNG